MTWIAYSFWIELAVFLLGFGCGRGCLVVADLLHRGEIRRHSPSSMTKLLLSIATGVLFVTTFASEPSGWLRACWGGFWVTLVMMVSTDMASMRVPNRVSLSAAVLFVGLGLMGVTHSWLSTVAGAACCSGLLFAIHVLTAGRGMGMGDVKLYLSIGAMLGPWLGIESLISASAFASIVGGVMLVSGKLSRREPFAFVPYIFAGVVFAVYFGPALNAWYNRAIWP